jgi:hypothetical protein
MAMSTPALSAHTSRLKSGCLGHAISTCLTVWLPRPQPHLSPATRATLCNWHPSYPSITLLSYPQIENKLSSNFHDFRPLFIFSAGCYNLSCSPKLNSYNSSHDTFGEDKSFLPRIRQSFKWQPHLRMPGGGSCTA